MDSRAISFLVVFLIGAAIGTSAALLLVDRSASTPEDVPHKEVAAAAPPAPSPADERPGTLDTAWSTKEWVDNNRTDMEAENEALRRQIEELLVWISDNLPPTETDKPGTLAAQTRPLMSTNGLLSNAVVETLDLGSEERTQVDTALANAAGVLDALLSSNTVVRQRGTHRVDVRIPPTKDGEAVRSELLADLRKTLGPDRYTEFVAAWGSQLEREMRYFGTASQSLSFRLVRKDDEPTQLAVSDRVHIDEGNGRHTSHHQHSVYPEIPKRYRDFIEWPPDEQP